MESTINDGPEQVAYDDRPNELTHADKSILLHFPGTEQYRALMKLARIIAREAADIAISTDPADEKLQRANMTVAHAKKAFVDEIEKYLMFERQEKAADIKSLAAAEAAKEMDTLTDIVLNRQ